MPSVKQKKAPFKNPFGSGFTGSRSKAMKKREEELMEMEQERKAKKKKGKK